MKDEVYNKKQLAKIFNKLNGALANAGALFFAKGMQT